jgi:hypothetical protein
MVTGWIRAFERREANPRGGLPRENRERFHQRSGVRALVVSATPMLMAAALAVHAEDPESRGSMEKALAAVRDCIAKSPAPWPPAWQEEYVDTIRATLASHPEAGPNAPWLEILREGFPSYWKSLKKGADRTLFEVHQAQIRWYVDTLRAGDLATAAERQKLRAQCRDLMGCALASLTAQFPLMDPNVARKAKEDCLAECYRGIEVPLLPTFRRAFTEDQVRLLKDRWTNLCYARVDLWRQLREGPGTRDEKTAVSFGEMHPDYLLTKRSLDQLRGQIWSLIPAPPDYYRDAVSKESAALKQRVRWQAAAHTREMRLGVAVWQTEYLSFLLTALLETADIAQDGAARREQRE